jgi:hypothetical protein
VAGAPDSRANLFNRLAASIIWRSSCLSPSVIRYYIHAGPAAFRFELAGDLDADDVARLEREWRSASLTIGNRVLVVDMSFVTGIDEAARSLFRRWYARGAEFAASSKESRELVESITERPYTRESPHEPTYQPWFSYTKA